MMGSYTLGIVKFQPPIATDRTCRFIWITDVLPHAAAERIGPLMEQGVQALKASVEAPHAGAGHD